MIFFKNVFGMTYALINDFLQERVRDDLYKASPLPYSIWQMVEVRVPNLDCEGCAAKLRKALFKLKGVDDIDIENGDTENHGERVRTLKRKGVSQSPLPPVVLRLHFIQNVAAPSCAYFFHTPAVYSVAVAPDRGCCFSFKGD
nr:heavy metal-associated isoprenylated plant protein 31 isoform X1 [Ipomoea batatas]